MYRALALRSCANESIWRMMSEHGSIDRIESDDRFRPASSTTRSVLGTARTSAADLHAAEVEQVAGPRPRPWEPCASACSNCSEDMARRGSIVAEGARYWHSGFSSSGSQDFFAELTRCRTCAAALCRAAESGGQSSGPDRETLREIEERDKRDSERNLEPLRQADDALMIDSSSFDADQVMAQVLRISVTKTRKENQIDRS